MHNNFEFFRLQSNIRYAPVYFYWILHIFDFWNPPQHVCSTTDTRLPSGKAEFGRVTAGACGSAGAALFSTAVAGSTGASTAGAGADSCCVTSSFTLND